MVYTYYMMQKSQINKLPIVAVDAVWPKNVANDQRRTSKKDYYHRISMDKK
jgi:hypothetical protein